MLKNMSWPTTFILHQVRTDASIVRGDAYFSLLLELCLKVPCNERDVEHCIYWSSETCFLWSLSLVPCFLAGIQ